MALVKCPECKKKISDMCENCPNCGYPLSTIKEINTNRKSNSESIRESSENKKAVQKWWVWVAIGVVIVVATIIAILLLNRDTKPKFDEDGNPVYIELTNEVYTNAEKYKGYHVDIKGEVFQVMSDSGTVKGIHIWIDPGVCEQNMMIYYSTDDDVKKGDYITCSGYIDSVTKYKNAYGTTLYAPLIKSSDLKKATYIDVMSPTITTIKPVNLKHEKYGYSISIDKIEFAEKETRVYATVKNNGKATLNIGNAIIVQNGKQYNSTDNYEAGYEEIPREIVGGVSSSGIIVFPAISNEYFELSVDMHSGDYDEKIDEFAFLISEDKSDVVDRAYKSAVQIWFDFFNGVLTETEKILPQGVWNAISKGMNATVDETELCLKEWYDGYLKMESFVIESEQKLSQRQLEECVEDINERYRFNGYEIQSTEGYKLSVRVTKTDGKKDIYFPFVIKVEGDWYWVEGTRFITGPFTPATY